jgi:phosphoribosylformylglycinamidine cyclo-ligase
MWYSRENFHPRKVLVTQKRDIRVQAFIFGGTMGITYKDSGVDVEAGNNFVRRIKPIVKKTFSPEVVTELGGFGALYKGSFPGMTDPILVSGTDGCGTKLKIAQMMDKHDTVGIDAVAMCVNDILVSGAKPLFFLDYIACGKLRENVMVDLVTGLAEGCLQAGCSLVGGETAEHPGVMPDNDYDIAGFSVGVVDKPKMIDGSTIAPGDAIIGIPSSGVHSNGFSMVRRIMFEHKKYTVSTKIDELGGTLGESLLTPTRIYCKNILGLIHSGLPIKGLVHITGGGFYENMPRIFSDGCGAVVDKKSFPILPVFNVLQREGSVSDREMFTTFNMGIGLMLFCPQQAVSEILAGLASAGEKGYVIGEMVSSPDKKVEIY